MAAYRIWAPVRKSVNGRSLVDPLYPEDLEAARYEVVGTFNQPGAVLLDKLYDLHQNGIEEVTGIAGRNNSGMRSLAVGDVIQIMEPYSTYHMVMPVGFELVRCLNYDESTVKFER